MVHEHRGKLFSIISRPVDTPVIFGALPVGVSLRNCATFYFWSSLQVCYIIISNLQLQESRSLGDFLICSPCCSYLLAFLRVRGIIISRRCML